MRVMLQRRVVMMMDAAMLMGSGTEQNAVDRRWHHNRRRCRSRQRRIRHVADVDHHATIQHAVARTATVVVMFAPDVRLQFQSIGKVFVTLSAFGLRLLLLHSDSIVGQSGATINGLRRNGVQLLAMRHHVAISAERLAAYIAVVVFYARVRGHVSRQISAGDKRFRAQRADLVADAGVDLLVRLEVA